MNLEDITVDYKGDITICRLPDDPSMTRPLLQKRLDFAHRLMKVELGSYLQIDDSGFDAFAELTQGSPGFTLYAFGVAFERLTPAQLSEQPIVLRGDYIRSLDITREAYEEWHRMGCPVMINVTRDNVEVKYF